MKKIGLLVLALVLALGSLGIAYARWSDTVTIEGTVNTGTVDLNVIDYSGTWVYKDPSNSDTDMDEPVNLTDEMWIWRGPATVPFDPPANSFEVAHAVALPAGEDAVLVEFVNLFPCVDFTADVVLRYDGTIPVKVTVAELTLDITKIVDDVEEPAIEGEDYTAEILLYTVDGDVLVPVDVCTQLHEGDVIHAVGTIHIIQTDADPNLDMMGASGTIEGEIEVTQWNEVCLDDEVDE